MLTTRQKFQRRKARVRYRVRRFGKGRLRLTVFRSSRHMYAQIIDDTVGETLAAAGTVDPSIRGSLKTGADVVAAREVGRLIAERARAKGITQVVFDRGGYIFHGRVKALADAAREAGLSF